MINVDSRINTTNVDSRFNTNSVDSSISFKKPALNNPARVDTLLYNYIIHINIQTMCSFLV